jgi:hypothetical protein
MSSHKENAAMLRAPSIASTVVAGALALGTSGAALAAGDMLQPDEVQTTGIEANPKNNSGGFIGAGLAIGQARTPDSGSTPATAFYAKVEPGYQIRTGSWNRVEVSADLSFGTLGFRLRDEDGGKVTAPTYSLIARAGYGYSLGNTMFGLFKVGVGPVFTKLKFDGGSSGGVPVAKYESDALTGVAWQLGYLLVIPMTDSLDATAGFTWTQTQLDVGSVHGGGATQKVDRNVLINQPLAEAGLRFRF